ncbi:hypothetical protein CLOM_g9730 [Closterium sp. NIES-68]|nr:hypothetical protein CLOM_g9730 [Closterium sp. NIES-68]GJP63316.1 hypothetical protein CLOP_g20388 [Closterium sp. NIES-67]
MAIGSSRHGYASRSAAHGKGSSLITWVIKWLPLVLLLWILLAWTAPQHILSHMFGVTYATPASIAYAEAESAAGAAAIAEEDGGSGDDMGKYARAGDGGRGLEEGTAEGGGGPLDDEGPLELPLRVYLYPLPAAFNFAMLQAQWNVGCRLDILAQHGVPPSWNFNASSSSSSSSTSSLATSADGDADGDGDDSLDQAATATVGVAGGGEEGGVGGIGGGAKDMHLPLLEDTDELARASGWSSEAVAVQVPCYHNFPYYWQHSVEYYLTLSLLFGSEAVVRVEEPSHADIVFLPYFSTLAFRLKANAPLNARLLPVIPRLATHPLLVPAVYPVTFANHSRAMQPVRKMAVDLDMYPPMDADPLIDVVVPYAALVPAYSDDPGAWHQRPTLLYFRGNKWRAQSTEGQPVRRALAEVLAGQRGVVFEAALAYDEDNIMGAAGGLRRAKYCLSPEGDTSSSCRLFDSILSGCVPVVVSDAIDLPFEDRIDYSTFALFVPTALAVRPGHLLELLRGQSRTQWQLRWANMRRLRKHFEFSSPPESGGAEDTVWRAVSRRMRGSTASAGAQRNRRQRLRLLLRQLAHYGLNASHLQQPVHVRPPVHL